MPNSAARRIIDRIDSAPHFTEDDAAALNARFANADTHEMLSALHSEGIGGRIAAVSSFGAESAVLLHLIAQIDANVPVLFLDTGKHFAETLAYRDALVGHLGLTNVITLTPEDSDLTAKDESGLRWSYDPDGCCHIRKVLPLERALKNYDATFTGRKAFQAATRAHLPRFEIDTADAEGRLKINPLIDWDANRINAYFDAQGLPRHPLIAQGYPSIGCAPCTNKVAAGEDPRSGRWSGWDKTECGIHKPGDEPFL